jgi:peptide/nickel transport system substrate-binding protein
MVNRAIRLRWRRRFKRSRNRVEDIGVQAGENLERHLFKRLGKLVSIRRFIVSWLLLLIILISVTIAQIRNLGNFYLQARPVPGGTLTEGIVGTFTNANPLYANNAVDNSLSKLLFASLFKYDSRSQLVGDLASEYTVNENANIYTVKLRPDLKWHDGFPLTSADVVFTYNSIQNPDAKSPLFGSWRGISVVAKDATTIEFTLPNSLSSFPYSMTNGIAPRHLLSGIAVSQLRSISFNTQNPVGSGPFTWEAIEVNGDTPEDRQQRIALNAYPDYYAGKPKLNKLIIRTFLTEEQALKSFESQELNSLSGVSEFPKNYNDSLEIKEYNVPLLSQVMIFLRTSNEFLSDSRIRKALKQGTDQAGIISNLGYPVKPAQGPFLESHFAYDPSIKQFPYDPVVAAQLLDSIGWVVGADGIREKDGKKLSFGIYSLDNAEYSGIINKLSGQWRSLGVDAKAIALSDSELQTTISIHSYDALVYGISVGVDPDVFAYWHSSQANVLANPRTNLSEYISDKADDSLEAGRTRTDQAIRTVKYRPFLEAWREDVPAIALYQPRFLYISRGDIYGLELHAMTRRVERYSNVHNWMIREERQSN